MSQSDYIKYKRITQQLTDADSLDKMPRVSNESDYIGYKGFTIENTVWSQLDTFHKYVPDNVVNVFGMLKDMSNNDCLFQHYINCNGVSRPNVMLQNPTVILNSSTNISIAPSIKIVKWNHPEKVTIPPHCMCDDL